MKPSYIGPFLQILVLILVFSAPTVLNAQDSARGNLTVDGTTASISNIYFDQYKDEFTIILTDSPVAPKNIPFGITELSEQGKVRALKFTVSRETKELMGNRGKAIFFHPVWDRNIYIGKPEIKIIRFDENSLVGSIKTTSAEESEGHKFSYDISFNLSLKKEAPKLTFKGKSGPQVDSYKAYCQSIQDENVDEFKKYVPTENLQYMPKNNEDIILGLEFVRDTMMTVIEVVDIQTNGNSSVLTMKGSRGIDSADGTVNMVLEDETWKVSEESWEVK